jgi:hypothetical protein
LALLLAKYWFTVSASQASWVSRERPIVYIFAVKRIIILAPASDINLEERKTIQTDKFVKRNIF